MDENDAVSLVREFLAHTVDIKPCDNLPITPCNFVPGNNCFYFRISLFQNAQVGTSDYVAVSKTDGKVTYVGILGE